MTISKDNIKDLLTEVSPRGNFAIERALIVLFERQTTDEQNAQMTSHKNGRGFASNDAEFYSKMAKKVLTSKNERGNRLSAGEFNALRPRVWRGKMTRGITKYAGQLVEAAEQKAASRIVREEVVLEEMANGGTREVVKVRIDSREDMLKKAAHSILDSVIDATNKTKRGPVSFQLRDNFVPTPAPVVAPRPRPRGCGMGA